MKVAGVMVVRDEAELVAATIAYHRAHGIDRVLVIDHSSVDATPQILARLSAADPEVRWRTEVGVYHQDVFTSGLAREAHADGFDWVVPIDGDEFWWSPTSMREVLAASKAGALECGLVNFVQERRVLEPHRRNVLSMRWRAEVRASEEESPDQVRAGQIAFLEMHYPPKTVCRPTADVIIHAGSHVVELVDGEVVASDGLSVLHAPLRCRATLDVRAETGRRVRIEHPDPTMHWHLKRLADLGDAGQLDAEWRANSVVDGRFEAGGSMHQAVPDDRLARAAAPYLRRRDRWLARLGR